MQDVTTTKRRIVFATGAVALLAAFAFPLLPFAGNYMLYVLSLAAIYGIASTGLTLFMGYAGQLSLCQAAFYGVGAYTTANLTKMGLGFLPSVLLGMVASGLLGTVIGLITLRLRGFYLAIITLAFGLIAFQIFKNFDIFTGGVSGIGRIPLPTLAGFRLGAGGYYYVNLALLLVVLAIAHLIIRSPTGRAMRSIASNELAAQSLGIRSYQIKAVIFAVAACFAGLGGGLYANLARYVTPDDFGLMFSILFITIAIVGGLHSVVGGLVGALVITLASEELRAFPAAQPILYGLVLILLVRFMPLGVAGSLSRLTDRLIELAAQRRSGAHRIGSENVREV